jgi:two-component system response regulator HydG
MDALVRYEWPGNARELENIIERAVILTRGEVITRDHFPGDLNSSDASEPDDLSEPPAAGRKLKDLEKEMILRTLEETRGNRTRAADILGIGRRTLQLKLKEYAITRSEEMPS